MALAELFQEDIEEIKEQICDNYCKYPEQYKVNDEEFGFDQMQDEVCVDCPLCRL